MDGYAGCGRGCMSKRQPLLKRFYYRRAWRLFCWRMSGHPGGAGGAGRAPAPRPLAGGHVPGPLRGRGTAAPPPWRPEHPGRQRQSALTGRLSAPVPTAGEGRWVPRGAAAGAKRPELLGRAAAGRPPQQFVWQARGPGAPGRQTPPPPRASPPRRQAGLGC